MGSVVLLLSVCYYLLLLYKLHYCTVCLFRDVVAVCASLPYVRRVTYLPKQPIPEQENHESEGKPPVEIATTAVLHATIPQQVASTVNDVDTTTVAPPTRAPRVYLGGANLHVGQIVELSPEQTRYIVSVMRLRDGSPVRVFDGVNGEFRAAVCGVPSNINGRGKGKRSGAGAGGEKVEIRVEQLTRRQPSGGGGGCDTEEAVDAPDIELLFSPIRKQRLKILVEKAVEVGASRLTPVLTARTQKSAAADTSGLDKLGLVTAVEAAEQCERMTVPHVEATPVPLASLLEELGSRHTSWGTSFADDAINGARAELADKKQQSREEDFEEERCTSFGAVFVCKERDVDAPPLLDALAEYAGEMVGREHTKIDPRAASSCSRRSNSSGGTRDASAAFLIGPEGGFEPEEIRAMAKYPFVRFVSLGPTVLRAETAAVYALSCWSAFWAAKGVVRPAPKGPQ